MDAEEKGDVKTVSVCLFTLKIIFPLSSLSTEPNIILLFRISQGPENAARLKLCFWLPQYFLHLNCFLSSVISALLLPCH